MKKGEGELSEGLREGEEEEGSKRKEGRTPEMVIPNG